MKRQSSTCPFYTPIFRKTMFHVFLLMLLGAVLLGIGGCKGADINPTAPATDTPTPEPNPTITPEIGESTPSPEDEGCDNYGETPYDSNLIVLRPDGDPTMVSMDCTGDIDWYKIEISQLPARLEIELVNLPGNGDFDLIAYDANLVEMRNGRSARTGNVDERLLLDVTDYVMYIQIHAYNGKGTATLHITTVSQGGDDDEEFEQYSYEEILFQEFPLYPRGTMSSLLERSVETTVTKTMFCQLSESQLTGTFTIGNYAHVERDFLQSIDYIDGWALVVFNGSKELLNAIKLTIRVTLYAPELDLQVDVPYSMDIDGNDYSISTTQNNVYYVSQKYGDFFSNSSNDIRITSGVVGSIGDLFANNIFTQQVEVSWEYEDESGDYCSGRASGRTIIDFTTLSIR